MTELFEHSCACIGAIDDQTLFLRVGGDVRDEDVEPFFEVLGELVEERSPARILVDATYLGETDLRIRWRIWKALRGLHARVERTAVFGLPPRLEGLLWLALALLRRHDVRSFLWRHEAQRWVQSGL